MKGIVKSVVNGKPFGFIKSDERKDYFFHRQDFVGFWDDLVKDMYMKVVIPVEFDVIKSTKGPRASNVHRIDFPNQAV